MDNNPFKIENESGPKGDLKGLFKTSWVEGSFDIDEGDRKLSVAHTRNYIGTSISEKKNIWFFSAIIIVLSVIFTRSFYLQIIKGSYFRELAEGNRVRMIPIAAQRGIIYDRNNRDLLKNIPGFALAVVPQDIPKKPEERKQVVEKISQMSGLSSGEIESTLKKYLSYSYQTLTIKDNLDYNTALKLYIENANLPGIEIVSGSKRGYYLATTTPDLLSLSHIIGYVGKLSDIELDENRKSGYLPTDLIGKAGLEKTYEKYLRGTYGRKKIEVNAVGKEQNVLAMEPPTPGKNLILTLDIDAQRKLEDLVRATAEKTGKKRISAIAMDPNDGSILAMVSWPSFNNNDFIGGIDNQKYQAYMSDPDKPLFDRVIAGLYPPGSTVKLIMSAAALQEKIITPATTFLSVGGITVGGKLFKDWKAGGHGYTNVRKALAWSVNTFYYYIGGGYDKFSGLGIDRIVKYFKGFGMGQKTGIDLPGESTGFIPSKDWKQNTKNEIWYVGDTYNVSIGQGDLLVSPLQDALWTAAVANGGKLVTPHFVNKVVDPVTKAELTINYPTKNIGLVSDSNLAVVRDGMRDCVKEGSCGMLRSLSFPAAGKTGTAQWSKSQPTHAWFTSFAPYQKPKIVVTVMVENGGEGSVISQPIAYQFLDWWGKQNN